MNTEDTIKSALDKFQEEEFMASKEDIRKVVKHSLNNYLERKLEISNPLNLQGEEDN